MSVTPTQAQVKVATAAARQSIEEYSHFDSAMVPDSALEAVVKAALTAALNVHVTPPPTPKPEHPK